MVLTKRREPEGDRLIREKVGKWEGKYGAVGKKMTKGRSSYVGWIFPLLDPVMI